MSRYLKLRDSIDYFEFVFNSNDLIRFSGESPLFLEDEPILIDKYKRPIKLEGYLNIRKLMKSMDEKYVVGGWISGADLYEPNITNTDLIETAMEHFYELRDLKSFSIYFKDGNPPISYSLVGVQVLVD